MILLGSISIVALIVMLLIIWHEAVFDKEDIFILLFAIIPLAYIIMDLKDRLTEVIK